MTALKRDRKAQSHTATGKTLAMTAAASTDYAGWPRELVDLPKRLRDRRRALAWFDRLSRHRVPEQWQAGDAARIALLARAMTAFERETALLAEEGGDATLADKWHAQIGQMSRHLGLSRVIRDPHLLANDVMVRAEMQVRKRDDDDLLSKPSVN